MTALEQHPLLNVAHQLVQSSTSFIRSRCSHSNFEKHFDFSTSSASSDTDDDNSCDREVLLPKSDEMDSSDDEEMDAAFL